MIKAIFFDIDGTLLSYRTNRVPDSTIEAFKKLRSMGLKLFIATGRPLKDIKNLDALSFDGFVTMNGAYCVDASHQVLYKGIIHKEDLLALFRYQTQEESFPTVLVTPKYSVINYVDKSVKELSRMVDVPTPETRDLRQVPAEEVLQMSIFIDEAREQEIMKEVLVNCQTSRWHPTFTDVNKKGVSKQSGIDQILSHYNLDLKDSMAFGDGGNDISMLRHVPLGVAMGNATDRVKKAADYVTDSVDENGIWNALQKLVWKK